MVGCKSHRPYCHGRCVFAGHRCFFSVCSSSPYREEISETCADLVHDLFETENEDGGCLNSCTDLSTEAGEATCQSCLITNLPQECIEMSGASCFKCSVPVLQALEACTCPRHVDINFIESEFNRRRIIYFRKHYLEICRYNSALLTACLLVTITPGFFFFNKIAKTQREKNSRNPKLKHNFAQKLKVLEPFSDFQPK